jgi:hypothetical protein
VLRKKRYQSKTLVLWSEYNGYSPSPAVLVVRFSPALQLPVSFAFISTVHMALRGDDPRPAASSESTDSVEYMIDSIIDPVTDCSSPPMEFDHARPNNMSRTNQLEKPLPKLTAIMEREDTFSDRQSESRAT